jgi:hypothetical protein
MSSENLGDSHLHNVYFGLSCSFKKTFISSLGTHSLGIKPK